MSEVDEAQFRRRAHALADRLPRSGPRYTSYPTAVDFHEGVDGDFFASVLRAAARRTEDPWSLYVHIPFCRSRCDFCACAVVPTRAYDKVVDPYLRGLERELELVDAQIGERRRWGQLHLGGGTPTYLAAPDLERLLLALTDRFERAPGAEFSVELDPRVTTEAHLDVLAAHGVDRVSLGVQDFSPSVQRAIGRHQTLEQTSTLVRAVRARGIASINVDLVYGLPGQTRESIAHAVQCIAELGVDRVALYGYAHVPWMRPNQRRIDASSLPGLHERLDLLLDARRGFGDADYAAVGMDHFARPEDPLARAAAGGALRRNFMGYTDDAHADLLAFGVTAISDVGGVVAQNPTKLRTWVDALERGDLPTHRGVARTSEDRLRGDVIAELMCNFRVEKRAIEAAFGLSDFDAHFVAERARLAPLVEQGIVRDTSEAIEVDALGELFIRVVAMAFDERTAARARFSAAV